MINAQLEATKIRPRLTLEAMYLDGTRSSAKAIVDWMSENRTEHLERAMIRTDVEGLVPSEFAVDVDTKDMPDFTIYPNRWIVRGTDQFMVFMPEMFQQTYEVV